MNKTYNSIWNQALGTWVAAPETARQGRAGGTSVAAPLALASALLLAGFQAQASTITVTGSVQQASDLSTWTPASPPAGTPTPAWDLGTDYLALGRNGTTGTLDIANGAQVSSGESMVGYDMFGSSPGSSGTVTVTGAGSSWSTNGNNLLVGMGRGGSGTLNIADGGQVSSGMGAIGYGTDIGTGSGMANVTGAGSAWSAGRDLMVGYGGTGTLNIADGGQVSSNQASVGFQVFGTNTAGAVNVTGAGSKLSVTNGLTVGRQGGTGVLDIADGGQVSSGTGLVADGVGSIGTVNVVGSDSTWSVNNRLIVAQSGGSGTLNITDGGQVSSGESYVGYDQFGNSADFSGTVNVTGAGSAWSTNGSNLIIGFSKGATGTLNITDGGQVSSGRGGIGHGLGDGVGVVNVSGAGSTWSIDTDLNVGLGGRGTLNIADGGRVSSENTYVGHNLFGLGSSGAVSVTGPGSQLSVTKALIVALEGGSGTLDIADGGKVISNEGIVADQVGSNGAVNVTGVGSTLAVTNDLRISREGGTAVVNVDQGGVVSAGAVTITDGSGSHGTVNLLGNAAQGRGVLETGQVLKGEGTATLNLDGGILRATADQADFLQGFSNLDLGANGVTFDTNSHNVAVGTAFASAAGQDGGLTKQGAGTLTMNGINTYTGMTDVAQGTLQAGEANVFSSTSAHNVATGAMLDLAGHDQTLSSLNNSGAVNLSGGTPGTVLTVTGPYVGHHGTLGISTVLGADDSITDKLLLSGADAIASGNTAIQVTNAGGLGAQTTGNGIVVVATENGASLEPGSFTLAGEHVDAGAFEYRLFQTAQGAALKSTIDSGPGPEPGPVAYRSEVALMSALPAQLRQADMAMLGDMHKRMGDEGAQAQLGTDQGGNRRIWGRVLRTDPTIRQQGTVTPESSGHMTGFQAGLDLYADHNIKAGLYVGQLQGDMSTKGFASGIVGKYVGFNNLRSRYLGVYGTWQDDTGLYADAVLQGADYRSNLHVAGGTASATTKGSGWLASLETGKTFAIDSHWQIEPQAQIIYRKLNLDDTALSLATVQNQAADDWTLRLGARIKGSFTTSAGQLQPYGRINIYKASNTTDVARFITQAATTDISAKGGYTSTELAAGASLQLSKNTSIYGELGKLWSNGGQSRVKSGVQASMGVKVLW